MSDEQMCSKHVVSPEPCEFCQQEFDESEMRWLAKQIEDPGNWRNLPLFVKFMARVMAYPYSPTNYLGVALRKIADAP